jgi:hypothetical protein
VALEVCPAPRNRLLNEIPEGDAHRLTWFKEGATPTVVGSFEGSQKWLLLGQIVKQLLLERRCWLTAYPTLLLGFHGHSCVRMFWAEIPDNGVLHSSCLWTTYSSMSTIKFLVVQWSCG